MDWTTLNKGGTHLHIAYGHTHTNNLYAYEVRVRTRPSVELSLDLNGNLRTRNKEENTYYDARELAQGKIAELKLVQLDDERTVKHLGRALKRLPRAPSEWTLVIQLEGRHSFRVRPKLRDRSLFLHVLPNAA